MSIPNENKPFNSISSFFRYWRFHWNAEIKNESILTEPQSPVAFQITQRPPLKSKDE